MRTLVVAVAAGAGAVTRYLLDQIVQHRATSQFPYGTLLINVTGSLLLGLVLGLSAHHGFSSDATVVVGTGFAGGYTTLSTWAWETLALAESGARLQAVVNVVGSVVLGLLAAATGFGLALL
ncbi:MAG: CrcB protein [Frankiales bacterium]|nr:CrcB protein [Frankiales bacterium]